MPTKREREYYRMGYEDGRRQQAVYSPEIVEKLDVNPYAQARVEKYGQYYREVGKPKRKLSAWNKYVKANSKKPRFIMRSGKLNLKKMAVAFRKTPAGKKRRK